MMKLSCIFLASGHSKRFHKDKLLEQFNGKPLVDFALERLPTDVFSTVIVVSRSHEVLNLAEKYGFIGVENDDTTDDISRTISLGVSRLPPKTQGCMFSVCDQPLLSQESIRRLAEEFCRNPEKIVALSFAGRRGNPVFFPKSLFPQLLTLQKDQSGGAVIAANKGLLTLIPAKNELELMDIDSAEDYNALNGKSL